MDTNTDLAFFMDSSLCMGCKACVIACKDKHNLPLGVHWRRVIEACGGEWMPQVDGTYQQNVCAYYISLSCNHCADPACVRACPTGATHKTGQHGIVAIDESRCVGCHYCEWNCPYSSPQYNAEKKHMTKCDFCRDLLAVGQEPACVTACPARALSFGPREELLKKYGRAAVAPLPQPGLTQPSLALLPHRDARPAGAKDIFVANREEMHNG